MAVSKLWPVTVRLATVLDYASNPEKTTKSKSKYSDADYQALRDVVAYAKDGEKTERELFCEGIHCNPQTAREQFITVKEQFGKPDGIQAYHGYLSFEETECDYAYRDELRKLAQEKGNGFLLGMLREIDPETAEKLHENNLNRIIRALEVYKTTGKTMSEQQRLSRLAPSPYEPCMIQLDYDRETLYDRINRRVDIMLAEGLIDEARQFMKQSDYPTAAQAIGYKELMPYLKGKSPLTPCVERLKQETRKYAKRQLTWFRRDERIHYIKADGGKNFSQIVDEAIDYIGSVRNKSK